MKETNKFKAIKVDVLRGVLKEHVKMTKVEILREKLKTNLLNKIHEVSARDF